MEKDEIDELKKDVKEIRQIIIGMLIGIIIILIYSIIQRFFGYKFA